MKKKIIRLAIVLVALVVLVLVAAFIWIDQIAKAAIERGGTYALGVDTTLDNADVEIFSGEFSMSGLHIANPEKFKTPHFLTLDDGFVEVSLASLRKDVVQLPTLTLTGIDMNLERGGAGANYEVILDNLKKLESEEDAQEEGKKFIINEVAMRDIVVHVDLLPVGGELTKLNIPFDEILLNDVGSETTGGMLLSDLSGVLIKALLLAVVEKGGDLIPADVLGELQGGLNQLATLGDMGIGVASILGGSAGDLLDQAGDLTGDIGKTIEGLGGDVGREIGNLLGDDD